MKNLLRLLKIIRVFTRYQLDVLILQIPPLKGLKPLLYLSPYHYFPSKKPRGERLRLAFEELGPIFIKFGQVLSTRRDLLPDEISDELAKLQDNCPPFDANLAKEIIEKSLGDSTDNLFKSFDLKPLKAASIAQIHTAISKNDEPLIIKIVRPDVEAKIKQDLQVLYLLAGFLNRHRDGKLLRAFEVVAEFERIILAELNMQAEAANAILLRENFADSNLLYVPRVFLDLCRPNILVTERIYGTPISDIATLKEKNIDLKKLAEDGVKIFFTQVFKHNFFHADMHPGNIFVGDDGHYLGVDFGIMGALTSTDQNFLAEIFLGFFNRDYKSVARAYIDSGWVPMDTDFVAFESAIRTICEPMFEKPLGEISFADVLLSLLKEARQFNISIQPQLLLLDKTLLNIEGLGRQLYPELDLWATAKPLLEQITSEKTSFKNTIKKLKKQAPKLLKDLPELPELLLKNLKQSTQIEQIIKHQTQIIKHQKTQSQSHQNAIFSASFLILSAIFAVNLWWFLSIITIILSWILWLKTTK